MRRVVVTGCGIVSPLGVGVKSTWEGVVNGKSGIDKITLFDATDFACRIAGEVKDFKPPELITHKERRRTARFVQFALAAAEEAIRDSRIDIGKIDSYRAGVIVGSGIGSLQTIEEEYKILQEKGPRRLSPFLIPMLITNEAAGMISIYFNLKGKNYCPVTACATGTHSLGEAFIAIKENKADIMLAGGTEASITPMGVGGFCAAKALTTTNNDSPKTASKPFDARRDGFVMSEGAGIVVLEELEYAKKRGADIYAEVVGYGATSDAYHITAPDPNAEAQAKAIEFSFKEAGVSLEGKKIYINAHGTSTKLNDKIETLAIKKALGSYAREVFISSTKSSLGHTLGAAGGIEFIISCLVLKHKIIPPTINYEVSDPECDLYYTPNKAREENITLALSNSFGFGGHNATILLKEFK